ncbi:MAG: hypothetical protein HY660_15305 [Armatimonadetes bacterium]|nr:hypothetical protein [Armatimonadota bacterium]
MVLKKLRYLIASQGERKYAASSRAYVEMARSRLGRVASELVSLEGAEGPRLAADLRAAFERCRTKIFAALDPYLEKRPPAPPPHRVIKVADAEYHLPCSVCGEIAVVFKIGVPEYLDKEGLIYMGITHSRALDLADAAEIFHRLDRDQIAKVHAFVKGHPATVEGIDAYCPQCDRIYCREHYNVVVEWDQGFYDCSYGTCPEGHRRMIDDWHGVRRFPAVAAPSRPV